MSNSDRETGYSFGMRGSLLTVSIVVLLSVIVVVFAAMTLPVQPRMSGIEIVGESIVVAATLITIVLVMRISAHTIVSVLLGGGAAIFYLSTLMNVLDEIFAGPASLRLFEDLLLSFGIVAISIGLFLFVRNQRNLLSDVEEARNRMAELSITDGLTGLYNSRHFYDRLNEEMTRGIRYQRPLSLLLIDIDDFKRHNDEYGHVSGDRVLRRLGRLVLSILRENDSAYRYGGEEFTVILPETGEEQAVAVAERMRVRFERELFENNTKSVSVGVATYRQGDDSRKFVEAADHAMYRAKRTGKNRVEVRVPEPAIENESES